MPAFIAVSIFGVIMIVLGIINMMGNIRSLHWYHRQRVLPEDVKPFGRLVGIGNITLGVTAIVFGALQLVAEHTGLAWLTFIGVAALISGVAVCLVLSFYGMIKYNKGIF